jgi:hypothetical protein
MNRIVRFIAPMALALALGACSGEADVDVDNDTAGVDANVDVAPADSPAVTLPADSAGAAVTTDGEGMEKLVEAKLIAAPGFGDVDVESSGEGAIVLTGSVATEAEKMEAERLAKEVDGVMTVTNNITIK